MPRYDHAGRLYNVVSLERLVYRVPRNRLFRMLGRMPGATAVDVGCGTGLNVPALRRAVGPSGRIVGIDASPSMLSAARRRVRRARSEGVTLVEGDAQDLEGALRAAQVDPDEVAVVVATFVLSLLRDDAPFWHTVDQWARRRPDAWPSLIWATPGQHPAPPGRYSVLSSTSVGVIRHGNRGNGSSRATPTPCTSPASAATSTCASPPVAPTERAVGKAVDARDGRTHPIRLHPGQARLPMPNGT